MFLKCVASLSAIFIYSGVALFTSQSKSSQIHRLMFLNISQIQPDFAKISHIWYFLLIFPKYGPNCVKISIFGQFLKGDQ